MQWHALNIQILSIRYIGKCFTIIFQLCKNYLKFVWTWWRPIYTSQIKTYHGGSLSKNNWINLPTVTKLGHVLLFDPQELLYEFFVTCNMISFNLSYLLMFLLGWAGKVKVNSLSQQTKLQQPARIWCIP